MKKYKWILILFNLVALLVFFNFSMFQKEKIISDGKLVLLRLAPVDPRSLMQGDFMRLNYEIQNQFGTSLNPKRGYCIVKLDTEGVASGIRLQKKTTPLYEGEYALEYNVATFGNISIGAESFFFQEGKSKKYDAAKYGGIRIDKHGNSVLVGLYNENREEIK